MLAMKLYPDVQAKAQAEIDRVVGSDRFPTMADKESLPYLNAVLLETLRWHSPAPAGGFRSSDISHFTQSFPRRDTSQVDGRRRLQRIPDPRWDDRPREPLASLLVSLWTLE